MLTTVDNTAPPLLVWHTSFPTALTQHLVSSANPHGSLTNSNLELAGSVLHTAAAQNYNIWEYTILSKMDNMPTLYWQPKAQLQPQLPQPTYCTSKLSISTSIAISHCMTTLKAPKTQ